MRGTNSRAADEHPAERRLPTEMIEGTIDDKSGVSHDRPNRKPRRGSRSWLRRSRRPWQFRVRHRSRPASGAGWRRSSSPRHVARNACRTFRSRSPRSTRETIAIRGLKQMDDYARFVPGLSISEREPGGTTIVFRGVASSGLQFGSVSSSALYLDEQPITQSGRNPDPRLIDIERVEALRGPQGTLYGASSQSGTLRIITNKPDPSEASMAGSTCRAPASTTAVTRATTSASCSMCRWSQDRLALRLVGFTAEDAGFIDNVLSDSPGGTLHQRRTGRRRRQRVADHGRARGAALGRDRQRRCDLTGCSRTWRPTDMATSTPAPAI